MRPSGRARMLYIYFATHVGGSPVSIDAAIRAHASESCTVRGRVRSAVGAVISVNAGITAQVKRRTRPADASISIREKAVRIADPARRYRNAWRIQRRLGLHHMARSVRRYRQRSDHKHRCGDDGIGRRTRLILLAVVVCGRYTGGSTEQHF